MIRRAWLLLTMSLAVAAVSACAADPAPSAGGPVVQSVPPSASPDLGVDPNACAERPKTNLAEGDGSALRTEVLRQFGSGDAWNIAIPADGVDRVPQFKEEGLPQDWDGAFRSAYDEAGAFVYGSAVIRFAVENTSASEVSIFDLRPVNMSAVCMPDGLLVLYGSEGGDLISMQFDLEAARPIAHENHGGGNVEVEPYFANHSIDVAPAASEIIEVETVVSNRAFAFDLALEYTVGGQRHTQVVSRPGGPFRVTPSLCPRPSERAKLAPADADRLRAHRYTEVRQRTGGVDAAGRYVVEDVPFETYAQKCATW